MLTYLAVATLVSICGAGPTSASQTWVSFLACSIERSQECKARLQSEARDERKVEAIRKLAQVLLEEWDWPSDEKRLKVPRLVWSPSLDLDAIKRDLPREVEASLVVVKGMVGIDGSFSDPVLLTSSRYNALNQAALDAAVKSRFRPARGVNEAFVQMEAELPFYLHVN